MSETQNPPAKARAVLEHVRDAGQTKQMNPRHRAAADPTSKRKAINAMCFSCHGGKPGTRNEIAHCTSYGCALWPQRPYRHNAPAGHGVTERAAVVARFHPKAPAAKAAAQPSSLTRAIRAFCTTCMGHDQDHAGTGSVVMASIRACPAQWPPVDPPTQHYPCPLWPHRLRGAKEGFFEQYKNDLDSSLSPVSLSGLAEPEPGPEATNPAVLDASCDTRRGLSIPLLGGAIRLQSDVHAWHVIRIGAGGGSWYLPRVAQLPALLTQLRLPVPTPLAELVRAEQRLHATVDAFCAGSTVSTGLALTLGAVCLVPVRYDADKTSLRPGVEAKRPRPRMVDAWDCRWAHNQTLIAPLFEHPDRALRAFVTYALRTLPARSPAQLAELIVALEAELAAGLAAHSI